MGELITVIIPIYNVEKYLDRCMESVVNQTYRNLEIIMIDDGSPDRCPQICDAWARKDQRIRVIHKKNAGLGMARNTGIEAANGKYICFFDSDDYVAIDILEESLMLAEAVEADITFFGMSSADNQGQVVVDRVPQSPKSVYEGDEILQRFLPDLINDSAADVEVSGLSLSVCSCLFRMDLIKRTNWRLVSERVIISEDSYSLLTLFKDVQKVAVLPKTGYYYCYNPVSQTQTYRTDRYEKIKQFYIEALRVQKALDYSDAVKMRLARLYMGFVVGALKQIVVVQEPLGVRIKKIGTIVSDTTLHEVLGDLQLGEYPWKIRLLCWMMRKKLSFPVYLLAKLQTILNGRA